MGSFLLQTMAKPYLDSSALPEALASNGWLGNQRCCPGENGCVCSNRTALGPQGLKDKAGWEGTGRALVSRGRGQPLGAWLTPGDHPAPTEDLPASSKQQRLQGLIPRPHQDPSISFSGRVTTELTVPLGVAGIACFPLAPGSAS